MLGIVALFEGVMLILNYYKIKKYTGVKAKLGSWFGVVLVVLGLLLALWPSGMATIFTYFIAIWLIVDAVKDLSMSWPLRAHFSRGLYVTTLVLNILMLVGGVVLLFNPSLMQATMGVIIGISLLLSGAWCALFAVNSKIEA
jgi:uncharacterized membrane protein HdeD (DUF308 family)